MKRKNCWLGMIVFVAILLILPGVSPAAMWVGGELGANFALESGWTVNGFKGNSTTRFFPAVMGGVTIGYDFINSGFLGHNWPEWMKYFSFATDFTYNRLNVGSRDQGLGRFIASTSNVEGYEAVWTFMFIGHYGFLSDTEVPAGRLNPYLGIGPAIMFSGLDLGAFRATYPVFFKSGLGSTSSTNIALVVEPGIRWMALKNVSLDMAMRYRYAQPSYNADSVTIKSLGLNQLSFLARANYHF